jgi:nucleotide-binding universal stress UspA family protein
VDLSEAAREVLAYAAFLARPLGASLEVLFVWEPPLYMPATAMGGVPELLPEGMEEAGRAGAQRELEALVQPLREAGVRAGCRLETGRAASVILERAAAGFDLVVMGTHGRGALARLLLGSVATRVVAHAPCPVVTVRPGTGHAHGVPPLPSRAA